MKKKGIILILAIASVVLIVVMLKKQGNVDTYKITHKDVLVDEFTLTVPQVSKGNGKNQKNYKKVNKLIVNHIEEYFQKVGLNPNGTCELSGYKVEKRTKEVLSIICFFDYTNKEAAHPIRGAFAINIDMKKVEIIGEQKIREDFNNIEFEKLKKVDKRKKDYNDGKSKLMDEKEKKEVASELNKFNIYYANNGIGFICDLIYARGGYAFYEKNSKVTRDDKKVFWEDGGSYSVKITYAADGEEEWCTSKGIAKIHKVKNCQNAVVYNIIINSDDKYFKNESMEYFYVEDEKIYIVDDYNKNRNNIDSNNLQLVYQQENLEEDGGEGLHYSITNDSNAVIFSLYTNLVETGYYNRIEWGKARNIVLFKRGFGAGRDLLQVEFNSK